MEKPRSRDSHRGIFLVGVATHSQESVSTLIVAMQIISHSHSHVSTLTLKFLLGQSSTVKAHLGGA